MFVFVMISYIYWSNENFLLVMFEFANVCDECFCPIMDILIYFHGLFNIIVLVSNELIGCILFCVPLRM